MSSHSESGRPLPRLLRARDSAAAPSYKRQQPVLGVRNPAKKAADRCP